MVTIEPILEIAGWKYHDFTNALRRGRFSSEFEPGVPGQARQLSRENAREIAIAGTLDNVGLPLDDAFQIAEDWVSQAALEDFGGLWVLNPIDGALKPDGSARGTIYPAGTTKSIPLDSLLLSQPDHATAEGVPDDVPYEPTDPGAATRLVVVDVGELIRRVDQLFDDEEKK